MEVKQNPQAGLLQTYSGDVVKDALEKKRLKMLEDLKAKVKLITGKAN